jgi:multidrug efflux system membrane fusion protein
MMPPPKIRRRARVLVLASGLLLLSGCSSHGAAPAGAGSPARESTPVVAVTVVRKTVPEELNAIGTVQPYATVAVKARVDGELTQVSVREGQPVRQGDVLFTIDPRPMQAQLDQAEANLARDRALLANALAQDRRYTDLLGRNFISKEAYAQIHTNLATAQATLHADQAAVDNARLQLAYGRIRSPISGVAGKILIQRGNLIKANDSNPLVVLNQVRPIYVEFAVPEQRLDAIRQALARGAVAVAAQPEAGAARAADGRLSFVDNSVDPATGTIALKATFPNRDQALWPGEFVRVSLTLRQERDALVVPAAAVQAGPDSPYAFVVHPDMTVVMRPLSVERTWNGETLIARGLAAGERVVIDGQSRLSPGAKVELRPAPAASMS